MQDGKFPFQGCDWGSDEIVSLSFQTSENLLSFSMKQHASLISLVCLAGFKRVFTCLLFRLGNQLATQLNTSLADWKINWKLKPANQFIVLTGPQPG